MTVHFPETKPVKTSLMAVPQAPKSIRPASGHVSQQGRIRRLRPNLTIRRVFSTFPEFLGTVIHAQSM
jgi:hypothetical protein